MDLTGYKLPEKKNLAKYKWQDDCVNIAKVLGVSKGLLFKCWSVGGYALLTRIQGEISDRIPKNPTAYLLWLIKNWK